VVASSAHLKISQWAVVRMSMFNYKQHPTKQDNLVNWHSLVNQAKVVKPGKLANHANLVKLANLAHGANLHNLATLVRIRLALHCRRYPCRQAPTETPIAQRSPWIPLL